MVVSLISNIYKNIILQLCTFQIRIPNKIL